jgi:hypothetical protein
MMPNATPEQRKEHYDKMGWMFEQDAVNYIPLSATPGQACANCIFYRASGFDGIEWPHCHIVADWPDPIEPTGWCDRWETKPEPPPPEPTVAEAISELADALENALPVEMAADETRHEYYITPADNPVGKLRKQLSTKLTPGTRVLKDTAGQRYMWMVTSNGYRDRDDQHVATKALQEYVDACWTGDGTAFVGQNDHYFWHWKELGSISDLKFADVWSGFLVELWREQPNNPIAKAVYNFVENHPEIEWGSSHGFYANLDGDTFKHIKKFESTTLPTVAAANLLTLSEVLPMNAKGARDGLLDRLFKEEFGLEGAAAMLHEGVDKVKSALDAKGIQAKSLGEGSEALKQARADAIGNTAELILSIVEVQNEFDKQLGDLKTARTADQTKITALETQLTAKDAELKELREIVNAGPRRATTDNATVVKDEAALKAAQEQNVEYDPAFPGMKVPLPAKK